MTGSSRVAVPKAPLSSRIEVKICGVRTVAGARACAEAGADFAGLNRVAGVARAIVDADVPAVLAALGRCTPVLVVRDRAPADVLADARRWGVTTVQLHGNEAPAQGRELAAAGLRVVKALHLAQARDPELVASWAGVAWRFVVDGRDAGSGRPWNWAALQLGAGRLAGVPVWLAGGLRPDNVGDAVAAVGPAGVDTASGVEAAADGPDQPRRQSARRIALFVTTARSRHAARQAAAGGPATLQPQDGARSACN